MSDPETKIDLIPLIPMWLREADEYEGEAEILISKAQALRQMVEAVQILNGATSRVVGPSPESEEPVEPNLQPPSHTFTPQRRTNRFDPADGPRGRDAVRLIVSERPGKWSLREIAKASAMRGWPSTRNALATAVQRMASEGEARWVGKGYYEFPCSELEASAPVTGDVS